MVLFICQLQIWKLLSKPEQRVESENKFVLDGDN